MFLSKSTSGIYYLYYQNEYGKRSKVSTKCKVKSDALKFVQNYKSDRKNSSKQIPLSQFITTLVKYADTVYNQKTSAIYSTTLNKFMALHGNIMLKKITPLHWDEFKSHRLRSIIKDKKGDRHLSPVSVNIELRTLKSALFYACRWTFIEHNPFSKLKLCEVVEQTPMFFTREDFQKLILLIKENWLKEIIIFATLTGMRRGEIVNLKWCDVDLKRKIVSVQNSVTFKTKTGKRRNLPLNDTALYILQQKANTVQSDYVFTLNGKQICDDWLSKKFKKYVVLCKFREERLHFHSLRHTFASWLVQDGVSLFAVSKLLGHSDTKITEVYSHLQPETLHETVNKIHISMN